MYYSNIPVFAYKINYPSFRSDCSSDAAELINEHYLNAARSAENYCRTVLFTQAMESAKYVQPANGLPGCTFNADYKITYNEECIVSLFMDSYTYMGGAHGETKRASDTWNFKTGTRQYLNNFYPVTPASLYKLQQCIEHQIEVRTESNPGSYFDDYKPRLQKTLHLNNYYLKPDCCVIYFQQYDIAPYSTGIPEFAICGIC